MCIGTGIGDDNETGLLERSSNVICKIPRSEPSGNCDGTGMSGELENRTLTIGASRDDSDISRIVDCGNDTRRKDNLFPIP